MRSAPQRGARNLVFNTLAAASLLTSEEKLSEMRTPEQQPSKFALWATVCAQNTKDSIDARLVNA